MYSGVFAHLSDNSGNFPNLLSAPPNQSGSCCVKAGILTVEVTGTRTCITVKTGVCLYPNTSNLFLPACGETRMNVTIDRMACVSCGACWNTCPDCLTRTIAIHSRKLSKNTGSMVTGQRGLLRTASVVVPRKQRISAPCILSELYRIFWILSPEQCFGKAMGTPTGNEHGDFFR